jgi:hypothetical protein
LTPIYIAEFSKAAVSGELKPGSTGMLKEDPELLPAFRLAGPAARSTS